MESVIPSRQVGLTTWALRLGWGWCTWTHKYLYSGPPQRSQDPSGTAPFKACEPPREMRR